MTEQQAAAALGQDAQRVNPPLKYRDGYAPLKSTVPISGRTVDAHLKFSEATKTLVQVSFSYTGDSQVEFWAKLRDLLTEKYGTPRQVGTKREWRFKTTIIELEQFVIPGILGAVNVRYYPATNYKDEKSKL